MDRQGEIEPSVAAVADTIIHEMPGEEVETLGRPVGEALNLILAIVKEFREAKRELSVSLVATPEEHIGVRFPDGRVRWIFISRPVIEPNLEREELN